jgi:exosortase
MICDWNKIRVELSAAWRSLPNRALFFVLLALWLAFFHRLGNSTFGYIDTPSLLRWMYSAYNVSGSDDSHGNLIPFIVLGLLFWKRQELTVLPKSAWPPALLMLAVAVLIHVIGYVVQQPRISIVGLLLGFYALMGLAWGKAWLSATAFPYVLMVFCIPVGSLAESLTFPLRLLVTWISAGISQNVLGIDVLREGSQIFTPDRRFMYDVAPACSGIRSLVSLLAMTTIYGFVKFQTSWKRALMVIITLPLAVIGNVVRITSVIVAADLFGFKTSEKVHDAAGIIMFFVAMACILALGRWLEEPTPLAPTAPKSS